MFDKHGRSQITFAYVSVIRRPAQQCLQPIKESVISEVTSLATQTTRSVEMDKSNSIETPAGTREGTGPDTKRRGERKLTLKVDVIRTLSDSEMGQVAGAWIHPPLSPSTIVRSTVSL